MGYNAISDISGNVAQFTDYVDIVLNHVGALSAYQKKLTIPYDGAMQTNFNDIRFNIWNGTAWEYVPYWLESKTDSSTADVWIKNDYNSGDTVVRMYYGNNDLSSGSNISDTFDFGDDFSDDLSKWDVISGTWVIDSGTLYQNTQTDAIMNIISDYTGTDYIVEYKMKISDEYNNNMAGSSILRANVGGTTGYYYSFHRAYNTAVKSLSIDTSPNRADIGFPFVFGQWYDVKSEVYSNTQKMYVDGDLKITEFASDYSSGYMGLNSLSSHVHFDDVRVRKYTPSEPTYTIGTPQHQRRHPQFI